jgi:hypothetical protein
MIGRGEGGLHFASEEVGELANLSFRLHHQLSDLLNGAENYGYACSYFRQLDVREKVSTGRRKPQEPGKARRPDKTRLHKELGNFLNFDGLIVDKYHVHDDMAQLHPPRFCDTLLEVSSVCRSSFKAQSLPQHTRKAVNLRCIDGRITGFAYKDGRMGKALNEKPDRVIVEMADHSQVLLPMDQFAVTAGPWSDTFREACLPEAIPSFSIRGMKEIHVSHFRSLFCFTDKRAAIISTERTARPTTDAALLISSSGQAQKPEIVQEQVCQVSERSIWFCRPSGDVHPTQWCVSNDPACQSDFLQATFTLFSTSESFLKFAPSNLTLRQS